MTHLHACIHWLALVLALLIPAHAHVPSPSAPFPFPFPSPAAPDHGHAPSPVLSHWQQQGDLKRTRTPQTKCKDSTHLLEKCWSRLPLEMLALLTSSEMARCTISDETRKLCCCCFKAALNS